MNSEEELSFLEKTKNEKDYKKITKEELIKSYNEIVDGKNEIISYYKTMNEDKNVEIGHLNTNERILVSDVERFSGLLRLFVIISVIEFIIIFVTIFIKF